MPEGDDGRDAAEKAKDPGLAPLVAALDSAGTGRLALLVGAPLLVLYLITASWGRPFSPDTQLNNLTAYAIANDGTVYLDDLSDAYDVPTNMYIVAAGNGSLTSQYTPGTALHAVPFYWLAGDYTVVMDPAPEPWATEENHPTGFVEVKLPPHWPGALVAAICTAVAMTFIALAVRTFAPGHVAAATAWVAGLATSTWTVGADELWQHSPGMMWAAMSAYLVATSRAGWSIVPAVVSVFVRPVAVVTWTVAAGVAFLKRRWGLVAVGAVTVVVGLGAVVLYNDAVFGEPSISGGYGPDRGQALLDRDPWWYLINYAKGLFAPSYGLFFWSPWMLLLLLGVRQAWPVAPDWTRRLALGGVAYIFTQWTLNRASGGAAYVFYRYPLEGLAVCAPFLAVLYTETVAPSPVRRKWFWYMVIFATAVHGSMALTR